MPGLLKVGKTRGHYRDRASELHTTGVPTPFVEEYAVFASDCDQLERSTHNRIKSKRVNRNREFFAADLVEIVFAIEERAEALHISIAERFDAKQARAEAEKLAEQQRIADQEALQIRAWALEVDTRAAEAILSARAPREEFQKNGVRDRRAVFRVGCCVVMCAAFIVLSTNGFQTACFTAGGMFLVLKIITKCLQKIEVKSSFYRSLLSAEESKIEIIKHHAEREKVAGHKLNEMISSSNDAKSVVDAHYLSKSARIKNNITIVLDCSSCGIGLRLPVGRQGVVECPECNRREFKSTKVSRSQLG